MNISLRKIAVIVDEVFEVAGRAPDQPLRKVAVVGIVKNPLVGRYVEDLQPLITASKALGDKLATRMLEAFGPHEVQSYGKGGLVGLAGEQEHANALLTTTFANPFRERIGDAPAWISSMTKVVAPGTSIDIPMNAKTDVYVRSHYDGMTIMLADAPQPDEIALIFCIANRGRINARVGGLVYEESLAAIRKS